jgi:high-affinity nickel permease
MNTALTSAFALLGFPAFTVAAGLAIITAIAAFIYGVANWRKPSGKVAAVVSGLLLALLAVVVFCVLLTVWSGSMG